MSTTADTIADSPIATLRALILECLFIPEQDLDAVDFIFSVFVSNQIPGDPLWGMIVDASGGGKTELLRSLRGKPDAYFMSKLTEKSLKSGYRDSKHPERDPSLLPLLNGKVLIIKDLSPILSMRRESRNTIIGDLRDAYDGFTDDGFGNVGKVSYESRFSLLAASTLAIERFGSVDQELGERFVKFRARGKDNRSKVRRAVSNAGTDDSWREQIDAAVTEFLSALPPEIPKGIPAQLREPLAIISDFTATARSHVPRDRNHVLAYVPRPEVGTRLGKELTKLLLSLAWVRGKTEPDEQDLLTIVRVAEDCLPPNRLAVLSDNAANRKTTLPETTTCHTRSDLQVLGILGSDNRLERGWESSLQQVRKSFSTLTLQKPATSRVSDIYIGNGESEPSTPRTLRVFQ